MIASIESGKKPKIMLKHKFKAELRAGVDAQGYLTPETQQKALGYLADFARRIQEQAVNQVKAVGTYTLRSIQNQAAFIQQAEKTLGFPIEVISGEEEARLVYVGATSKRASQKQALVIDIGGGSTELIIGRGRNIVDLVSLEMGCVSFEQRFFKSGLLTQEAFDQAIEAACRVLKPIQSSFKSQGWQLCIGYSGTIQMISRVMKLGGLSQGSIDAEGLDHIIQKLIRFNTIESIVLPGLREDRINLLPGGIAILKAIFETLPIQQLTLSQGGIREGVLYEMLNS